MIYIINFLLVPLYYGLFRLLLPKRKAERWFVWTFAVHAIMFRALAYPFDFVDMGSYAKAYHEISGFKFQHALFEENRYTQWGRGYVALNWLLSRLSSDYMTLFFILSVVTVGSAVWFYAKTSYVVLLTVMLYLVYPTLYRMGFAVLRQHLSAAVVLLALYHIKNYKVSVPLALLAPLLHASGIVMLPFFLWRRIKFKRLASFEVLMMVIVSAVIMRLLLGYLMNLLVSDRNQNFANESTGTNLVPVMLLGIAVAMALYGGLYRKCRNRDYEILNFLTYGFAISLFGIGLYGAGRLTIFFLYVLPVVITFPLYYNRRMFSFNCLCIALLLALTVRQMYYLNTSWIRNYDYKFYWEKPKLMLTKSKDAHINLGTNISNA